MKKLQLLALTMLFALVGMESSVYAAKCPAGQVKNSKGKCIKESREKEDQSKAKAANVAVAKAVSKFQYEQLAMNAVNAYNKTQNATTAQAATNAINNVIYLNNGYLLQIQNNSPVQWEIMQAPQGGANAGGANAGGANAGGANAGGAAMLGAQLGNNVAGSSPAPTNISANDFACIPGNDTPTCPDGTQNYTAGSCQDGTNGDTFGMCDDWSQATCSSDGASYATCADGTTPQYAGQ